MNNLEFKLNSKRNDFLAYILQSLGMPLDEFLSAVANPNCCYERTIHKWAIQLFERGKSKEQALKVIFKARILYFIRRTTPPVSIKGGSSSNLVELLQMLKSNDQYRKLSEEEKLLVQQKIDDLIGVSCSKEIISQVLEEMNPSIEVVPEANKIRIFKNTLNRLRKAILRTSNKPSKSN